MKTPLKYFGALLLFLWTGSSFAQLTVETRLLNQNLEVFFISGIDRTSGSGQPVLFEVLIGGTLSPNPNQPHTVRLELQLFKDSSTLLYRGTTGEFPVTPPGSGPPNQIPLRLTNRQLFAATGPFRIVDGSLEDAGQDLIDDVLTRGRLPSGRYTFHINLTDLTNNNVNPITPDFDIVISNPSKLDLLYPGAPATGRRSDCPDIFTNVPPVRWDGDMRFYLVEMAEARAGEDPESALNQSPNFRRLFAVGDFRNAAQAIADLGINAQVERIPNTSFQYPPSGEVLQFRPGKTYIWRVTGIVNSSSGPVRVESEIFCFRLANLGDLNTGGEQLKLILRQLLGPDDYEKLFGQGGELDGYLPKRISWNGEEMTAGELFFKIHQKQPEVSGYSVE